MLSAYADPDGKEKFWAAEDDSAGALVLCSKDDGDCKGSNVNKEARELCDRLTDSKCKQVNHGNP